MPTYFNKDYHSFFEELAANNNKDWMDVNRKRYAEIVKKPFENFVEAIQQEVSLFDEEINIKPGDAIFRINRDIRFSKDKTPYKTNRTAIISKFGRKDKVYPGFYVFASPEKVMVGGGTYFLEKQDLFKVRQEIAYNLDEFDQLINEKEFKKNFKGILGDKNKIAPKEFKEDIETQPLLLNKGFYFMKDLPANLIFEKDVIKQITTFMKTAKPFNDFLRRALS
ncbi:MAG: hypothetical protein ACI9QR_001488 [Flavobacteriaceae bacterium]|jgi:uncharacterized protein (TIGR02453 family)